ncbi:MAG: ABC transporter permease [bacterium]|nr:ABC transporter permease [bacterium]
MNRSIIIAMVKRYLLVMRHDLNNIGEVFYEPAMQIFIWGLASLYIKNATSQLPHIVVILLSGVVFWMITANGQYSITVNFLYELWDRNLVNIFASPLRIREWIISVMIVGFIRMLASLIFGIILTLFLYHTNLFQYGLLLIPFVASLLMTGWVIGFIVAGIIIRFGHTWQSLAWTALPIFVPFSAVFFPVSTLPLWAQKVTAFVPSSYVFEGMREIIFTNHMSFDKLLISFALNTIYLVLSILFFVYMFKKSRKLGLGRLI